MAFSSAHKHAFYSELAKLVGAGFSIRDAAKAMLATRLPTDQEAWLHRMEEGLQKGRTIAQSLDDGTAGMSGIERQLVEAGERSGRMAEAFQHLADYFAMLATARSSAVRAMVYPVFLLHLGVLAGTVPIGLMRGDKFSSLLLSTALALLVIYAVGAAVFFGVKALLNAAVGNRAIDASLNRIPVVGEARRNLAMARFTKVYHGCLLAGIGMKETVEASVLAAQSGTIHEAGAILLGAAGEGQPLGPAFLECPAFPAGFSRSYSTAEESGTLDKDLAHWARVFQTGAEQGMRTVTVLVPKILYALIVAFVGWQIVRFWSGYAGVLDQIGNGDSE